MDSQTPSGMSKLRMKVTTINVMGKIHVSVHLKFPQVRRHKIADNSDINTIAYSTNNHINQRHTPHTSNGDGYLFDVKPVHHTIQNQIHLRLLAMSTDTTKP